MPVTTEDLITTINANHATIVAAHDKTAAKIDDVARRHNELKAGVHSLEQKLARRGSGDDTDMPSARDTLGSLVVNHADFPQAKKLATQRGKITLAITSLPGGGAGGLVPADARPSPVMLPQRRLTIRDLVSPGQTSSNLIEYARQTVRPSNARVVTESQQKPESSLAFELVDAPVRTIAHFTKASRQIVDDAPQLQGIIDGELRYGLGVAEEEELLAGDGTGQHLLGIIPQAEAFSAPFVVQDEQNLDRILLAIAQVQLALLPATGVVVNDLDWMKMLAIKDNEGRYIGAGPFGAQLAVAWTVPVVATPAMLSGEFLVGAFRDGAQIFDRMEKTVMLSTEDGDNFIRNMVTILAEERLAFTVRRPQSFVYGEFEAGT